MKKRLIGILCALVTVGAASEALAANRTIILECDKFGIMTARLDPPGALVLGDSLVLHPNSVAKMTDIKYRGRKKIFVLPLNVTSGFIGKYKAGDTITFCARCDNGRSDLSCFTYAGPQDNVVLPPNPGCAECNTDRESVPTVSEWSLIIMTVLAFTVGTILFSRRRRAAAA